MAEFNADINLRLKTEGILRKIKRLENAIGNALAGDKSTKKLERKLAKQEAKQERINNKVRAANIRELNDRSKILKLLRQGEQIRALYAKDAERAAKAAEREAKATQKTAASAQKAAKAKSNKGLQSAALGVGFPLLFGGGAGSIAGGLLGSAGGFGGQILGSAIGQQIDSAIQGIAKLGQALNPLTADIDAVVKAVGESGTEFEKLVKELEKVAGAEAALAVVTERLAILVGQNGVNALKQFGDETALLGNTFSVTLTQIGAAVAELINKSGILNSIIAKLAFDNDLRAGLANTTDPTLQRLQQERQSFIDSQGGVVTEEDIQPYKDRIVLRQQELALQQQQNIEAAARNQIEAARAVTEQDTLGILRARLELEESGLDLTTEEGYRLAEKLTYRKIDKRETELIAENASKETRQLERQLALLDLKNRKKEADRKAEEERERAARKARSEAEAAERKRQAAFDKEQQVLSQIAGIQASAFQIRVQQIQITAGESEALKYQLSIVQTKYELLEEQIELSKQDARLKDLQIQKLQLQKTLEKEQLSSRLRAVETEKEILKLKQQQVLAGINTDIGRQIEDANFRGTGNASQDEQLQLRIDQTRRAEDVTTRLNDALAEQQKIIDNPANATQAERAEETRQNLQDQLDLYNQLLPQLNAAEQAQLRYNQVLQAAQPYAEAFATGLTQGLRDVVAGTKTAEEAFADFLNNIADMLIQTAATMIAQYTAIAIAKAFAGMGDGWNPSQLGDNLGGINTSFNIPKPYAEGGYVTGPQPAIVGEGGEPEYIIPASKMDGAMARYSGGTRGDAVIDGPGSADGGGGVALAEAPMSINISGGVTQIGNDEYIRKDQLPSIIEQSSKAGEARTMRRLQMNPGARRKIGM